MTTTSSPGRRRGTDYHPNTSVALLSVTSNGTAETVRGFDDAWHLSLTLKPPVNVRFLGFSSRGKAVGSGTHERRANCR